jgi:hypothetical protein
MRQNRNSILRSAVAEGKSINRTRTPERLPTKHCEAIGEKENAERPPAPHLNLGLAEEFLG